jgi:hypothetical protein
MKRQRPLTSQLDFDKFEKHAIRPRPLFAYRKNASFQSTSTKVNKSGSKGVT